MGSLEAAELDERTQAAWRLHAADSSVVASLGAGTLVASLSSADDSRAADQDSPSARHEVAAPTQSSGPAPGASGGEAEPAAPADRPPRAMQRGDLGGARSTPPSGTFGGEPGAEAVASQAPGARVETRSHNPSAGITGGHLLSDEARGTLEVFRVGDEAITWRQLAAWSRRVAGHLVDVGAGLGSRVLIASGNSIPYVVAYVAALRAGASVSLAGPMMQPAELRSLADDLRPTVAIVSADRVDEIPAVPTICLDDIRELESSSALPTIGSDTVAHIMFTSGTTGRPKATPLTHGNILASVRGVMSAWRWSADDVLVHALPMQHAHGLTAVHLTLLAGSRSIVLPAFSADGLAAAIEEHRATVLFGVPTVYEQLLASGVLARTDTSSLRLVVSGSAALSPRTSDALTDAFGTRPLERYGLTECGFVLSNPYDGPRLAGSVGYPLPGIEVELVDPAFAPVPDGTDGEIVVRGPQVFGGYLGGVGADSMLPNGWFRTGDVGNRSPDSGAISITGRLKELIITGGLNVYPREIELVLEAQPGVHAAAVVGVPSERWGEEVTAFVEADPGLDTDALAAAIRPLLAPYKRPKSIHVIETLPRNALGKLVRTALVDAVTESRRTDEIR
jgi:malonyl-CoA/methylmalonyl-CoA synthetase